MTTNERQEEELGAEVELEYQESYEMALRRGADDAALTVAAGSLALPGVEPRSKRLRLMREEWQVQSAAVVGAQIKGDLAVQGLGHLVRRSSESYCDTVEELRANKERAKAGEYQANINAVTNHLVESYGIHLGKLNRVVAMRAAEEVNRPLYVERQPQSFWERLRSG